METLFQSLLQWLWSSWRNVSAAGEADCSALTHFPLSLQCVMMFSCVRKEQEWFNMMVWYFFLVCFSYTDKHTAWRRQRSCEADTASEPLHFSQSSTCSVSHCTALTGWMLCPGQVSDVKILLFPFSKKGIGWHHCSLCVCHRHITLP